MADLPTWAIAGLGAASVLFVAAAVAVRDQTGLATTSLLAGVALAGLFVRLRRRRQVRPSRPAESPALAGFDRLDEAVLAQLARAVSLSEGSTLKTIQQVNSLRELSARLIRYLGTARGQSDRMQEEIDLNGQIVGELARFVERMPQQIARERAHLESLVKEIAQLSSITETIRGMARQTEILSINAAIAAAQAGEAGRAFSVLAGEVRRLATQSNKSALEIDAHIGSLVDTVKERCSGESERAMRDNETEAARLMGLTSKLDDSYLDMRQFYGMLLTAITEHNTELDDGIHSLLETGQNHDVAKQIIDRVEPALAARREVTADLIHALQSRAGDTSALEARATALATDYLALEASHRDPDAAADQAPGEPGRRIELF